MAVISPVVRGPVQRFVAGVAYLGRGIAWTVANPRQLLLGLIPAVAVAVGYAAALIALAAYVSDVARAITPFADHWSSGARDATQLAALIAILGVAAFLAIVTFTAVVIAVGQPIYERLAERVENDHGGAPPQPDRPLLVRVRYGIGDAVLLGTRAVGYSVLLFVLGAIPLIGQTVVPLLAIAVSGYLLTGELTAVALGRRGFRGRQRLHLLGRHRAEALGFGVAAVLISFIPLGAVLAMPGAVAGATLLARERIAAATP